MSLRRRKGSLCQGEGMPTDFRNILLIKPSSLGDIVHALPTAAVLRRRFPAASLTWLVKREWADVLEGNPCVDRALPLDLSLAGWPEAVRAVGRDSLISSSTSKACSEARSWAGSHALQYELASPADVRG